METKKLEELGFNGHRLSENPQEKVFLESFFKQFDDRGCHNQMDLIIFGNKQGFGTTTPKDYLTEREKKIVYSTIQWLGSPVGRNFLQNAGYELKKVKTPVINEICAGDTVEVCCPIISSEKFIEKVVSVNDGYCIFESNKGKMAAEWCTKIDESKIDKK